MSGTIHSVRVYGLITYGNCQSNCSYNGRVMTSSSQSVSGRPVKEELYIIWHSFSKKQKQDLKLNINITAVTSEATRVLKRLVSTIL